MDPGILSVFQRRIADALSQGSTLYGLSGQHEQYFEAQRALRAFFARPWFHRVWVVQEVLPALSGGGLFGADKISFLYGNVKLDAASMGMTHWCCSVMKYDYERIGRITPFNQSILTMKLRSPLRLIDILDHCQYLKASDPRDHCFALVGISEHADKASIVLRADYQESVKSTYTRFARHLVGEGHGARILLLCFKSSESVYTGLPSWVPDWSSNPCLDQPISRPHARWLFSAGGPACDAAISCGARDTLLAKGLIVDRLIFLRDDLDSNVKKFSFLREWGFDNVVTLRLKLALQQQYLVTMLWRTVNRKPSVSSLAELKENCRENWETAFRFNIYDIDFILDQRLSTPLSETVTYFLLAPLELDRDVIKKCLEDHPDLTSDVLHGIYQRSAPRIGVTDHRRLARLPDSAEEGDVIAVVLGCCVPLLLSPQKLHGKTVYKIKGMAYVHGIMDGEALEGAEIDIEQLVFI